MRKYSKFDLKNKWIKENPEEFNDLLDKMGLADTYKKLSQEYGEALRESAKAYLNFKLEENPSKKRPTFSLFEGRVGEANKALVDFINALDLEDKI